MLKTKILLPLLLSIFTAIQPLSTAAFLLPANMEKSDTNGTNSASPLETFLAASTSSVGEKRNQMGGSERAEDKVPKTDIIITPTHPRLDELVYVQALPQNFRNSATKLYFNWHIYNPDPKIGSVVVKDGKKVFIASNTLEGALIRGAIDQARGSYIPGKSPTAKDLGKATEKSTSDMDGYKINFGGDDGQGAIEKNIKDILGKDYDFNYVNFEKSCKQNCNVEYENANSENEWDYNKCTGTTCGDWLKSCCDSCQEDFTSCVSDVWKSLENDCTDKICDKKNEDAKNDCHRSLTLGDYSSCDNSFFNLETNCIEDRDTCCSTKGSCGSAPLHDCVDCDRDYYEEEWKALREKDFCEKKCKVEENSDIGSKSVEPVGSRCFRYNFGGLDSGNHMAGIFQPITCKHIIPGSKGPENVFDWESLIPFETGDNSFKEDEENFWGTDSTNADTDGDGFQDEADIAGLGQQSIQFHYQSGDKIGVAVEGSSLFPTNEKTPYYKIMWAGLGICNSEVISQTKKESPDFNNLCDCAKEENEKCKGSDDFGFPYLELKDIWQSTEADTSNRLETAISLFPLRPVTRDTLSLETIVSGNQLDKDLLNFRWALKHGGENLKPELDKAGSKIIWKKNGVETAYTALANQLAEFKDGEGVGWDKLNLEALLEGKYDVLVKAVETEDTKQKTGEASLSFEVSEGLKIKFYRAVLNNGTWEKRDELAARETTSGENIIAEYSGPFYDEFVWYADRKKIEGNGARISMKIDKMPGLSTNFKLIATSKNRKNIVEDETTLKVVAPYVKLVLRNQEEEKSPNGKLETKVISYQVPQDADLEIQAMRGPEGSQFASVNNLHYFWSLDGGEAKEGEESFKIMLDSKKYLPKTPHSLDLKIYSEDKKLLAQGNITLIPVKNQNTVAAQDSGKMIGKLAFAYLNLPDNLRFLLENFLWAALAYFMLIGMAWVAGFGERKRPYNPVSKHGAGL